MIPQQMEEIRRSLGDEAIFHFEPSEFRHVGFNVPQAGPWSDVRVRKAATMVIDRTTGALAIGGEFGQPSGLFYPGSPWINPDYLEFPGYSLATLEKDRADAKRLLADAGFADGFETRLVGRSKSWVSEAEFVAEQLRKHLNITVNLDLVDKAEHSARACDGNYDLYLSSRGRAFPDAMHFTVASFAVNPCAGTRHNDSKVDDLFQQIKGSTDHDERVRLSREVERYVLLEQAYFIPLWRAPRPFAARSYVNGIFVPQSDSRDLIHHATTWLDK